MPVPTVMICCLQTSDEVTKLSHEIERYVSATGELIAWVKVPSLSSTVDTDIYMYYGYISSTDQSNPTGVWDANYKGVWHLKEAGDSTGYDYRDSTSNAHNGQGGGGTAGMVPTRTSSGKIGYAQDFDNGDGISIPNTSSLQPTTAITLSGWIRLRTFGAGSEADPILRKGEANPNNYQLTLVDGRSKLALDAGDDTPFGATTLSANTWYYVVGTWQSGGSPTVYVNGISDGTGSLCRSHPH